MRELKEILGLEYSVDGFIFLSHLYIFVHLGNIKIGAFRYCLLDGAFNWMYRI